jgi:hypothetical protein
MMKRIIRFKRSTIVIIIIASSVLALTKCIDKKNDKEVSDKTVNNVAVDDKAVIIKNTNFQQFAGSSKCASCHKNIYEHHLQTAHYLSSQPALLKYIKGSFANGRNRYTYNPSLYISMEKRDSGFYQVVYFKGVEKKALRFDIAIGSGAKGQSYIYWLNNKLFQLPITYFTIADQWSNSPGFPNKVLFDRPITSRCIECHATFADKISAVGAEPEEFDHTKFLFGVDCEKCHGPAAKHVEFQTQNPKEKNGKYIINPARLSRQQNLDLCALCHGGNIKKIQPSFTFTAGDTLSNYFVVDTLNTAAVNFGTVDVHGNQYGLLKASKCFRLSETMTCNTCHNTHENERGKLALFSQRCMVCHNTQHGNFCTINPSLVSSLKENCIDCHMPAKPSKSIVLFSPGVDFPRAALFRSHFISIYPDETKKFIEGKNKTHQKD